MKVIVKKYDTNPKHWAEDGEMMGLCGKTIEVFKKNYCNNLYYIYKYIYKHNMRYWYFKEEDVILIDEIIKEILA